MYATLNATRYIPAGAVAIENPFGVVYFVERNQKVHGIAYAGKANKASWNYLFNTVDQLKQYANEWFAKIAAHKTALAKRAAERNVPHNVPVGAVIVNSWGYEQTNIDFYQVVKASKNYVWLQPISDEEVEQTGFMQGKKMPKPGQFCGEISKHRVYMNTNGKPDINFEYGCGCLWDGKPEWYSYYA